MLLHAIKECLAPRKVIQESLGFRIPHPWNHHNTCNHHNTVTLDSSNLDSVLQLWLDSGSH